MQESKIYLIFEYLTMDLKKYMDTGIPKDGQMDPKLTKSYLYQVIFHQLCLEQCLQLTYILSVAARHPVLSPEESPSQGHEASEPSDRQERLHQDRWFWSGQSLWNPSEGLHSRGLLWLYLDIVMTLISAVRWWLSGTGPRRSCSGLPSTPAPSTSGQLGQSTPRWWIGGRCSRGTPRLISYSESSEF